MTEIKRWLLWAIIVFVLSALGLIIIVVYEWITEERERRKYEMERIKND